MSSNSLVSAGSIPVASRQSRYTGKALARIDSHTETGLAQIESEAEMQVARVMAVGYVGNKALQVVAMAAQQEQQLATLIPFATSRLQPIGEVIALECAGLVVDTVHRISR